jgi:uncharacterized protein
MRRAGTLATLALVAATAAAAAEVPREIVVTGEGLVEVAPDMATVTAGVESQGETAGETLAASGEAMRAILAALEEAGVERRDIQTSQLALEPVYRPRNDDDWTPDVVGYVARNTVTVRVREIGAVGAVVDTMSEAGANRIAGIAFGIADMRPHLDEARGDAVRNARDKAGLYADAAGVALGDVLGIRETQPFDRPSPMMARAEMAMDGAVAEGTLEVTAMVEIVFAIAEDESGEDEDGEDGAEE